MDRIEFLQEVFNFFRVDPTKNEHLLTQYDAALSTKEPIDWQKLYNLILKEAESRTLPTPKWFRERFYKCYKQDDGNYGTPDGTKIRMVLRAENGKEEIREAETYHIQYTLEEMKEYKQRQYGKRFVSLAYYWESNNPDKYEHRWVIV